MFIILIIWFHFCWTWWNEKMWFCSQSTNTNEIAIEIYQKMRFHQKWSSCWGLNNSLKKFNQKRTLQWFSSNTMCFMWYNLEANILCKLLTIVGWEHGSISNLVHRCLWRTRQPLLYDVYSNDFKYADKNNVRSR